MTYSSKMTQLNSECDHDATQSATSRVIGEGGLGVVRAVYDSALGTKVAQKSVIENMPLVDRARALLRKEAQITARLEHPNIIPVYEFGWHSDHSPYFTMKLVQGNRLGDLLSTKDSIEREPEDFEELLRNFVKILEGISFAHGQGIIHGDIKPDNVMVSDDGHVYVIDWGNAVPKHGVVIDKMGGGSPVGSPGYMSPEQAAGDMGAFDERTDIFGLGAILYEMLTGVSPHRPFLNRETLANAISGLVPPPGERTTAHLPPELCQIAMRGMEPAKVDRYPSVVEMKRDVERYLASTSKNCATDDQRSTRKAA